VHDVPKSTVMVLLLLTIVVSILGTWTVLDASHASTPKVRMVSGPAQGDVQLTLQRSPTGNMISQGEGHVGLTILPQPNGG